MPSNNKNLCDKIEFLPNQCQGQGEIKFTEPHQNQCWLSEPKENKRDIYVKCKNVLEIFFF